MKECPECKRLFEPDDRPKHAQECCSRHCARIRQARHGIPSVEDKKAAFLEAVAQKFDEIFKPKE